MDFTKKPFKPNKMTLLTILLSSMVILMGAAAVSPALRPISEAFPEQSSYMISLIITLPALSVAITGFGVGYLADRFGKVKVLFAALIVFTVAGMSAFFLNDYTAILVGRFILGIGITGISSTTTALISEYWNGPDRLKVIGYQSAAIGVGTLLLETLGGSLADIGWREPFLIYLIGIPILILGILSVREPAAHAESSDARTEDIIPNKKGKIAFCYAMVFMEMFLMFSLPTNFSYYIGEIGGNLTMCGILLGVMGLAQAAFSLIYSRNVIRMNEDSAYAVAFLLMGIGLAILYIGNMATTFISMIFVGVSLGLLMPTVIGQLSRYSTARTSGKVMGGYAVALNLSTFISGLVVTSLHDAVGRFDMTFVILGVVSVAIFAVLCVKVLMGRTSSKKAVSVTAERTATAKSTAGGMYGSILIPTDGSKYSRYAAENAVRIAKTNGSKVTAIFVVDTERYSSLVAGRDLKEAEESVGDGALNYVKDLCSKEGIEVDTRVVSGHPADEIVRESANHDLVVCGSVGRTDLSRALLGSVAEKVARMAYCPVLIYRMTKTE